MKFGTPPHKLHKKDGIDTSQEAAKAVDTTTLEKMVYEDIESFGFHGCISDDILARHKELPYSSITARYRALIDKKYIFRLDAKRKGKSGRNQRVMVASKYMEQCYELLKMR